MKPETLRLTALLALLALAPACKRDEPTNAPDAGPSAAPPPSAAPAPVETVEKPQFPGPDDTSVPAGEASRAEIKRVEDDPLLARHRDAVIGHFKDTLPSPFTAQIEALPGDRRAVLIPGPPGADKPLVFVVDPDGTRAWTKELPLAGIVPGVKEMAIVRGSEASVGVAFCDSTQKLAALRTWHADGGINADYQVLDMTKCESIAALYWPGRGHVIAASGDGEARVGRIDERGMRAWGAGGLTLPWKPTPQSALTIAVDTDDSFILLGMGSIEGGARREGPNILAIRYNQNGKELWPEPISVARPSGEGPKRVAVKVIATGKLEIEVEKPNKRVELTSEGSVVLLPPRR